MQLYDYILEQGWLSQGPDGWDFDERRANATGGLPSTLMGMIEDDLSRCPAEDRELLEAASLAGFEFSSQSVAAALEQLEVFSLPEVS